jgi:hypothetical protein
VRRGIIVERRRAGISEAIAIRDCAHHLITRAGLGDNGILFPSAPYW